MLKISSHYNYNYFWNYSNKTKFDFMKIECVDIFYRFFENFPFILEATRKIENHVK